MLADLVLPSGLFPWQADGCVSCGHLSVFCMLWCYASEQVVYLRKQEGVERFLRTLVCQKASHTGPVATKIGATGNLNVC